MSNDIQAKNMVVTAARFRIKPEKRAEFLEGVRRLLAPTRAKPGCVSYNLYEDADEPNTFLIFEE